MTSTITIEQLKANGWTENNDPVFPLCKDITGKTPYTGLDEKIELVLHRMYNVNMFALLIPGGCLVNINPASIEELNAFEKLIISVEPPY